MYISQNTFIGVAFLEKVKRLLVKNFLHRITIDPLLIWAAASWTLSSWMLFQLEQVHHISRNFLIEWCRLVEMFQGNYLVTGNKLIDKYPLIFAFKKILSSSLVQRVRHQSNQKSLHHYQHSKKLAQFINSFLGYSRF